MFFWRNRKIINRGLKGLNRQKKNGHRGDEEAVGGEDC